MASDLEANNECTPLLRHIDSSQLQQQQDEDTYSVPSSAVTKAEQALVETTIGERLPYNDYITIDWLHDLVLVSGVVWISNVQLNTDALLGERLISSSLHPIPTRTPLQIVLIFRGLFGLACCCTYRYADCLCGLSRRCRCCNCFRLEGWILRWPSFS